jgi:hypothetical protein
LKLYGAFRALRKEGCWVIRREDPASLNSIVARTGQRDRNYEAQHHLLQSFCDILNQQPDLGNLDMSQNRSEPLEWVETGLSSA